MKTVLIHGQNHKGTTYHMARIFAEKVAEENEITEFFLPRDLNHFCLGCYLCLDDDSKCPFYEEKRKIITAIIEADLLIFSTPTYCLRASAPMKSFLDLTFINWITHRPKKEMFLKRAVVISSAAGAGTKSAMKDIMTSLSYWGIPYIKTMGVSVAACSWNDVSQKNKDKIERKAIKLAEKVRNKKYLRTSLKIKVMFSLLRSNMRKQDVSGTILSGDCLYWKANGWLEKERPWKYFL